MDREKLYAAEGELESFVAKYGWEYGIFDDDMLTVATDIPKVGIAYFFEFNQDGAYEDSYWEFQTMDAVALTREELEKIIRYANRIWYEIEDIINL